MSLLSNYRVRHKDCHGEVVRRTCQKCGKHWTILEHWSTLDYYSEKANKMKDKVKAKPDRKLTGNPVTDALPNWPRWARLTSTGILFALIGGIIYYVI